MQTKRELYSFVADLAARRRVGQPSLEVYLRSMWGLASAHPGRTVWTLDEFAELISSSFVAPSGGGQVAPESAFDERWRALAPEPGPGFDRWQHAILGQIVDLHDMTEAGMLEHELRYYGLDAPSGRRWYNFDTCSYLESAIQGGLPNEGELAEIDWDGFMSVLRAGREYE